MRVIPWQEWKGPVNGGYEHFFSDIYGFVEHHLDQSDPDLWDPEPELTPCDTIFPYIDADQVLEDVLLELHDEAYTNNDDELRAAIKSWNEKQTSVTWMPQSRTRISLAGFPWLDYCGTDERWSAMRAAIAREATDGCLCSELYNETGENLVCLHCQKVEAAGRG